MKLPILLTWGSADKLLPPRWAEEFARQLPDVTLAMINRGAHGVHLEQPGRLATLIRDFCQPIPAIQPAR
jgi:pimeloyl-ACP methyl ester carboxylesterase